MANEFNQRICNARDLTATLNDIVDNLDEGKDIVDIHMQRIGGSDDMLIVWRENGGE